VATSQFSRVVERPGAFGIGTIDRGGKAQQRPIGVDRRLADEIGTENGDRIVDAADSPVRVGDVGRAQPIVITVALTAGSPFGNRPIDPAHYLVVTSGLPQAGDDRPILRVFPFVQQVDSPIDIAVVIGELQQHGIDFKPAPVVATCALTVEVRDRRAVDRESMVVERVDEIREQQRRPSRRGGTESRQPPCEFSWVWFTLSTRLRVQLGSPLAFTADRSRRVVSMLGDRAQQGQGAHQSRPHDFGSPSLQVNLEFVEYLAGAFRDGVGLAIINESAELQGVSHRGFELGFRGRVVTGCGRGANLQHSAHFAVALGEGHDEFAKLVDVHRLHGHFQRRCHPSGVVDGAAVDHRESDRHQVLAEVTVGGVRARAETIRLRTRPIQLHGVDLLGLDRGTGLLGGDPEPSDIPHVVFAPAVAPVTGHLEQRTLRQRHTDMVPDRLGDSSKVSGMSERPYLRVVPEPVSRPDLRRARRRDVVVYRIRVHLDDSDPTIWRRLDLRSNLTLDLLHQVLQVTFDWTDSHLHRFSLGGGAFDHNSQLFLCPYDVDNKEWPEDDDGLPAAETRLDETLSEPGDVLHYLYDYGDNWELTLRLEEVFPAENDCPAVVVVDGGRAAPPEDCGHLVDADSLAEVLPNPALFEPERVNKSFGDAYFVLREAGIDVRLVDLVHRLTYTPGGDELTRAALTLAGARPLDAVAVAENLRAYQWFLDRAKDGGIALTTAGYLKPADVEEVSKVIPAMNDWIGKHNREIQCYPLLRFRESVQSLGLLRKHKGTLVLTRAGVAAQRDPNRLWEHLAGRLIPKSDEKFEAQATLLMLTFAAASAGSKLPFDKMTALLAELGWRYSDGRPISESPLRQLPVYEVLSNVTDQPVTRARRNIVSRAAAALARRALGGS